MKVTTTTFVTLATAVQSTRLAPVVSVANTTTPNTGIEKCLAVATDTRFTLGATSSLSLKLTMQ